MANFKIKSDGTIEADSLDAVLDSMGIPGQRAEKPSTNQYEREIDASNYFSGMMPKSKEELMIYHMQQQHQTSPQAVSIKPGYAVFKKITSIPSNFEMANMVGNSDTLTEKTFINRGKRKFLVIGKAHVDLGQVTEKDLVEFVIIEAPFVGTLLVKEDALRGTYGSFQERTLLKG